MNGYLEYVLGVLVFPLRDYLVCIRAVLAINQTVIYSNYMTTPPNGATDATDAEIGQRIANALIVRNVNVRALSDQTGISYPTLRRSLSGGRSLTIREIGSIASALSVQPGVLLPEPFKVAA